MNTSHTQEGDTHLTSLWRDKTSEKNRWRNRALYFETIQNAKIGRARMTGQAFRVIGRDVDTAGNRGWSIKDTMNHVNPT